MGVICRVCEQVSVDHKGKLCRSCKETMGLRKQHNRRSKSALHNYSGTSRRLTGGQRESFSISCYNRSFNASVGVEFNIPTGILKIENGIHGKGLIFVPCSDVPRNTILFSVSNITVFTNLDYNLKRSPRIRESW